MTERSEQPIHDLVAAARSIHACVNRESVAPVPCADCVRGLHDALARIPAEFDERVQRSCANRQHYEHGDGHRTPFGSSKGPCEPIRRIVLTTPWEDAE